MGTQPNIYSQNPLIITLVKTVIIRRGRKAHDTTPEIIVKNVKGNLLSNARKPWQHVQSYGTSHVKNRSNMAAEGTLTWINLPCLFLFPWARSSSEQPRARPLFPGGEKIQAFLHACISHCPCKSSHPPRSYLAADIKPGLVAPTLS